MTAVRRRVSSIQLTAFNQPSAITAIASVGHAPVTSEPNDRDPKACRDPLPSVVIVEFLLYNTQQLELEECAVRSDTACSCSFPGWIACCSNNEICSKTCLWRNAYMSLVVFLLARFLGDKAPCRTIIRNAFKWEAYGILYAHLGYYTWSPIKTMQEWHYFPSHRRLFTTLPWNFNTYFSKFRFVIRSLPRFPPTQLPTNLAPLHK